MPERIFYILAYDMADDRRRAKLARLMESMGVRVQGSVFEAYLTAEELQTILKKSKKFFKEKEDSLRIYTLCSACRAKVQTLGIGVITPQPGVVVV